MRYLVTGGAGFIGSHAVDLLLSRGHAVHVVDDLSTGDRGFVDRRAKLHVLDIRSPRLAALFRRLRPERVVHLAAHIDLRRSVEAPSMDADINIIGGLNVLESALAAQVPHLTFASSAAVYGAASAFPTREDAALSPVSPYGISKFAFEHYLRFARRLKGLKSASLRFSNVYGPRQTVKGEAGAVAIFANALLDGRTPTINGDGRQTRDFVYVGDVARMIASAASKRLDGAYNVSTGKETSVNRLYRAIADAVGSDAPAVHGPAKAGDDRRVSLDPRRARDDAGWKARVSVDDGIPLTVSWIREWKGKTR